MTGRVLVERPVPAGVLLGAARLPRRPVDDEVGGREGICGPALPAGLASTRADEIDAMLITSMGEMGGTDVGGVDPMLRRDEVLGRVSGDTVNPSGSDTRNPSPLRSRECSHD